MDNALSYKSLIIECPRHAGAFDCTSFCGACEGDQEIPVSVTHYPGCLNISATVNGQLEQTRFIFWGEDEAIASFVENIGQMGRG